MTSKTLYTLDTKYCYVYHIIAPDYDGKVLHKFGYMSNITARLRLYACDTPRAQIVEVVKVQKKTKHTLEQQIHDELINKGHAFIRNRITGNITEWTSEESKEALKFADFKCCKGRTIITVEGL